MFIATITRFFRSVGAACNLWPKADAAPLERGAINGLRI